MQEINRACGEALLREFAPFMGEDYARERNFDLGPGAHRHVSRLSPYVRRRLVLEQDLVDSAIKEHGMKRAEKFIQEVFWRGYFKGWLEQRPSAWRHYRVGLAEDLEKIKQDALLNEKVLMAQGGRTGLAYFDAWAHELVETGYLHNHARMWFASIWIFTLNLPWRVGADFFYRHLIDGDAASNTLSWRWVAGLHTRGKAYAAEAGNIFRYTRQRFNPDPRELAPVASGLEDTEPEGLPERTSLRRAVPPVISRPCVVLLTEDDCRPEDFAFETLDIKAAAVLTTSHLRSPLEVSKAVRDAEMQALVDTARRSALACSFLNAQAPETFVDWVVSSGARQIVTPFVAQGPVADWLGRCERTLSAQGIELCEWQRSWDRIVWPHATSGFFKVKEKIPTLLRELEGA